MLSPVGKYLGILIFIHIVEIFLLLLLILVMDNVGKCESSSDRHEMSTNIDVTYMCQAVT